MYVIDFQYPVSGWEYFSRLVSINVLFRYFQNISGPFPQRKEIKDKKCKDYNFWIVVSFLKQYQIYIYPWSNAKMWEETYSKHKLAYNSKFKSVLHSQTSVCG